MATAQRRSVAPARPTTPVRAAPKGNSEDEAPAQQMPMTVAARVTDPKFKDRVVSTEYDFGATLDEAVEKFGEAVVYGVFLDQAVIRLQALLRRCITDEVKDAEIKERVTKWTMTVGGRERKSAAEKVQDLLGKMSPEQKAELLKSLGARK